MKQLMAAMICALFVVTAHAQQGEGRKNAPAAEKKAPSEAQKKQQERMKDCNIKAEGKSGDERKQFMSSCLKGQDASAKAPSAAQKKQQERMRSCNEQAGGKKLDHRVDIFAAGFDGRVPARRLGATRVGSSACFL